ncbi:MAG: BamA/TamA family outer membrane protein [Longimicrobiales bacterium]|nr:BamA/TamA family outer membrane protein [Longimicrobiales bacterium]
MATSLAFFKAVRGRTVLALASLALALAPASAAAQVPPDAAWRTLSTEHFRVTFPENLEALGRRAADRAERAWSQLSEEFLEPPGERVDILLTDHADVSNGFAQIHPSNRITIYARPPADDPGLGYFDDWMELVVTHELAHVFHLDRAGPLGRFLRGVFGRAPDGWPFFPGVGVPRWTSEGLATWYESHFSEAGRVHGTYHDMIVRTAALEGRFEPLDQASGESPEWPGGTRAYAYGSLFFDYLLEKHGTDRMGAFAEAVAGQWVPYRLDAAGRKAFGASLSEEWRLWTEEVAREAAAAQARAELAGPLTRPGALTKGARVALYARVSRDGARLAYAVSDGRSDVEIRVGGAEGGDIRAHHRTNGLATFDWLDDGRLLVSQLELQGPYLTWGDLYEFAEAGGVRRITSGARLSQPSASPDGRWAVAVQDGGGTNALVKVDLATGVLTAVTPAHPDVHWSYPAVSPDGRWIAASRWTPGAFLDVVVLNAAGRIAVRVTEDRAVDLAPAWAPDGRTLLWGSDRTEVPNIVAAEVDPVAGTVGPVRMVTNLVTGAAYPSVDPAGAWVYFSGYHADGWEVERIPFTPSGWPAAPAATVRFDAPPRPAELQEAQAQGEVYPYSALPTLLPTYWEPLYREPIRTATVRGGGHTIPGRQVMSEAWGLESSGRDLVGRHAWNAFARAFTSGRRAEGGGSYAFAGLGNPVLSVGASQFWDDDGARLGQKQKDAPFDTLFVLERSRDLAAPATFLRPRWRRSATLSLSAGLSWERRELLDGDLRPSQGYRLTSPESRFSDFRATLAWSTARSHAFQVGAARGVSAFVRGRVRSHLALPDSSVGSLGKDRSVDDVLAQVRLFHALGGPGFASHVLALRASVGLASGPGADAGHFEAGGASGSMESVSGLSLFGGSPLFFPVRGYPTASRFGSRAWSASAEYRFPLALVNRGFGAWPLHLDRLTGALFADAGNAWGPELGIQGFQSPRRAALASVGAEVTGTVLALWSSSLQLRSGVGFPLVEGGGPLTYVRLGLSF